MKKVILKSKLENPDLFEDELEKQNLDFGPLYWLHDRVYIPRNFKRGQNLPRLIMRTTLHAIDEPPKYSLLLRRHIEDSGIDLIEETPVEDYTKTVNIILQLGFKPAGEVSRRRETLTTKQGITVHLDLLDDGSAYAKLESDLTDDAKVSATRENMLKLVKNFETLEKPYFEIL